MRDLEREIQPKKVTLKLIEIYRNLSGEKKLELAAELYEMSRELLKMGILSREPNLDEKELEKRVLQQLLPKNLLEKIVKK